MRNRVAGPLLAVAALGCAQVGTPPGGEPDQTPPRVRSVEPAAFDTLIELDSPVAVHFDERISERLDGISDWNDAAVVSPATSEVRVRRRRRRIEVSLADRWEPDRVYRVTLLPVYRDLFGNVRDTPVEVVFSTGAGFDEGAIAGFATDRLTGNPVAGARVRATRRIDKTPYAARTDTAGFFAMRFMPAGSYDLVAWSDNDRDREIDLFEIQDSVEIGVGSADTVIANVALLPQDTTPARLARAEALDSVTIRLLFDDYFEPGPVAASARLFLMPDSLPGPPGELVHSTRLDSILAARVDTLPAAPGDSLAPADSARQTEAGRAAAEPPQAQGRGRTARAEEPPLPSQELVFLADEPLLPDTAYMIQVRDLTNIRGVEGGGGTASFVSASPPPPDTTAVDSAGAGTVEAPDTMSVAAPPDTLPAAPPDTTSAAPPDTTPGRAPGVTVGGSDPWRGRPG